MSSDAVAPPQPEKAVPQRTFRLPREIGILGALGLMVLVLAVFIPQFRDLQNIINITRNFSFVGIVAMGMTLVILTGASICPWVRLGNDGRDRCFSADAWMGGPSGNSGESAGRSRDRTHERVVHHPFEDVAFRADAGDAINRQKLRA